MPDTWTDTWRDVWGSPFPFTDPPVLREENPFRVTIYDKGFIRKGWINDFQQLTVTPRHNQIGTALLVVDGDHRRIPLLEEPGARLVITYHGEHLLSGYVTAREAVETDDESTYTVTVQDDLWLMWRLLGWAKPDAAINAQTTKKDIRTGPAETVAKGFVAAQLAHNTVDPIEVATSLGRGSSVTVASRMQVLADQLMDVVDKAGIGLSARQVDDRIILDAYTPRVHPHVLSWEAGVVTHFRYSSADPSMTRAIIGGPNTDTSREFRQRVDAARESELGYTVEALVDAQSSSSSSEMDTEGDQALAAGSRRTGLAIGLSETPNFRYGGSRGVHVGDTVTVSLRGRTYTDVLREATLSFTADDGLIVTPTVGERSDDPDAELARFVAGLAGQVRTVKAR